MNGWCTLNRKCLVSYLSSTCLANELLTRDLSDQKQELAEISKQEETAIIRGDEEPQSYRERGVFFRAHSSGCSRRVVRLWAWELSPKRSRRHRESSGPSSYSRPIPPLTAVWVSHSLRTGRPKLQGKTRDFTGPGKEQTKRPWKLLACTQWAAQDRWGSPSARTCCLNCVTFCLYFIFIFKFVFLPSFTRNYIPISMLFKEATNTMTWKEKESQREC